MSWGKGWPVIKAGNETIKVDGNEVEPGESWSNISNQPIKSEPIELELLVPCKVQGEAVSDLMVYGWQGNWYVAHIPTETRFDQAVPEGDWTKERLIIWCDKVQKEQRKDWVRLAQANNENYDEAEFSLTKIRLKELCLEINVE